MDFLKITEVMNRIGKQPKVALTPAEVIYVEKNIKVLHYLPTVESLEPIPILLVPSLINKYYIMDLMPNKSLAEFLRNKGFAVFVIDWGIVGEADAKTTLEDYLEGYLHHAVEAVKKFANAKKVSLIGYCMGGTMSLIYSAVHSKNVQNLTLLATPIDFHNNSLLSIWAKKQYLNVDLLVDTYKNIPVWLLQNTFQMLKPSKTFTRYNELLANANNEEFVETFLAFDYWGNDAVPVAGETFRKFVKDTYQDNLLAKNKMKLGGKKIDLKKINFPILNVIAEHDNIVPPESSEVIANVVKSKDIETLKVKGGHHGITIGPSALSVVWKKIDEWLSNSAKLKIKN